MRGLQEVVAAIKSAWRTWLRGVVVCCFLLCTAAGLAVFLQPLWINDQVVRFHLWQQHAASHYVDVDGYRIHYFETEPAARLIQAEGDRPLVLVHGLGSRGEDWSPMIPTLASQGFHVYALDLLGYGRSAKPDVDYSIRTQEKLLVDFMHAMQLQHADLAGWSMGGWIALKLTLDHPELVDRLVVYDAAGVYFPPTFDASLFTPTDSPGLSHLAAMLTPQPKPFPEFVARAAIRKLHANAWVIQRSISAMEGGQDLLDFHLHSIRKPTLIVWGKQDALIPLSAGEAMHAKIPGSSLLVIDGCGHLAPGECSRPVLRGTVEFLKAQPPPRGAQIVVRGK